MIGIDTNVLVRIFTQDNSSQLKRAQKLITEQCSPKNPGFVSTLVLGELLWVLKRIYQFDRHEIAKVVALLLKSRDLKILAESQVINALHQYQNTNLDFSDILIGELNQLHGCETTMTFDKKASKLATFTKI